MQEKLTIQVWSEIQCPWCWVGKRRLERAIMQVPFREHIDVVYRAFRLMPNVSPQRVEKIFAAKHGLNVDTALAFAKMEAVASGEGLTYHLAGALAGDTMDAHRVVAYAKTQGLQEQVLEILYKAHFTDQISIFDRANLAALAAKTGIDAGSVAALLNSKDFLQDVETDERAAHSLGIRGVPHFQIGDNASFSGGRPIGDFISALTQAWDNTNGPAEIEIQEATSCRTAGCLNKEREIETSAVR